MKLKLFYKFKQVKTNKVKKERYLIRQDNIVWKDLKQIRLLTF